MNAPGASSSEQLRLEARLFSRYLLDRDATDEFVQRYVAANRVLVDADTARPGHASLATVHRSAWTLPHLDAAAGLFEPRSVLRRKLLIASAILETMPENASETLPRSHTTPGLFVRLAAYGAVCAVKVVLGIALMTWARLRRA